MYLLDTNVVSELRRRSHAHPAVLAWAESVQATDMRLSVVTVLEIELGIRLKARTDAVQAERLRAWLDRVIASHAVLPIDIDVARRCAGLHVPDPRPERDALIGATALVHGLTMVTRNVRDFQGMGLPLLNPWQADILKAD